MPMVVLHSEFLYILSTTFQKVQHQVNSVYNYKTFTHTFTIYVVNKALMLSNNQNVRIPVKNWNYIFNAGTFA